MLCSVPSESHAPQKPVSRHWTKRTTHMSYVIQAIVARTGDLQVPSQHFRLLQLRQRVEMLPLTAAIMKACQVTALPLTDSPQQLDALPKIEALLVTASVRGKAAYIEAEYFGGKGIQAAVLAERSVILGGPIRSPHAINEALSFLGVSRAGATDEFEAVGLGDRRHTDQW